MLNTKTFYKQQEKKYSVTHKGTSTKQTANSSAGTLKAKRQYYDLFEVLKGKKNS